MGAFAKMSFAENDASYTLADGFIGFGEPGSLGNGSYALDVVDGSADGGGGTDVPEPPMTALVLAALGAAW